MTVCISLCERRAKPARVQFHACGVCICDGVCPSCVRRREGLDRCRAAGLMTWGVADFSLPIWISSLCPTECDTVWAHGWWQVGASWQTKAEGESLRISSGCISTWMLSVWEEFLYWQAAAANMHLERLTKHVLTSIIHDTHTRAL